MQCTSQRNCWCVDEQTGQVTNELEIRDTNGLPACEMKAVVAAKGAALVGGGSDVPAAGDQF